MNHWIKPGLIGDTSLESIRDTICELTGISIDEIRGKRRKGDIPIIRQIYCYACCCLTDNTLEEIGKVIDKDHATVYYSNKAIIDKISIKEKKTSMGRFY